MTALAFALDDVVLLTEVLPPPAPHVAAMPGTVLLVDANSLTRHRHRNELLAAGYLVEEARDAAEALAVLGERADRARIDAAVVAATLPDTDGWGVVAALRDDAAHCDVALVLTSDDATLLRRLERFDVGADAYARSGLAVVDAVDALLARRCGLLAALPAGAWGTLADVGVQPLLDAACRAGLRGRLMVDDACTTWTVHFDEGVVSSAVARHAGREVTGLPALASLLEAGAAPFAFDVDVPDEQEPLRQSIGLPWSELARPVADIVNGHRDRTRSQLLELRRALLVDDQRLRAWAAHQTTAALSIARALARGVPVCALREVAARGRDQADEAAALAASVEIVVLDLLRRRVATL